MADRQYNVGGTQSVPADWVLPDYLAVATKMAYAHFDGTLAAGSYVPCLRIKSDSGDVVCEAVGAEAVAAGASVNVSWFPDAELSSSATFSGCRIWNSASQVISDASLSPGAYGFPLVFDSVIFDTDGYSDLGAHNDRLTIPRSGYYLVGGCVATYLSGAEFEFQVLIAVNGAVNQIVSDAYAVPAANPLSASTAAPSTLYHFTAGDYVQLVEAQQSGMDLTAPSQEPLVPIFWIERVG